MILNYGADKRKEIIKILSEYFNEKAIYLGVPSFAYRIKNIRIERNGDIYIGDNDEVTINHIKSTLTNQNSIKNLNQLLQCKGDLIKKALNIDSLEYTVNKDTLIFTSLKEKNKAYELFIERVYSLCKKQKRINKTNTKIINEKYTFRCFLLRLDLIGAKYKEERKVLLKNFIGSSAFRNGGIKDNVSK